MDFCGAVLLLLSCLPEEREEAEEGMTVAVLTAALVAGVIRACLLRAPLRRNKTIHTISPTMNRARMPMTTPMTVIVIIMLSRPATPAPTVVLSSAVQRSVPVVSTHSTVSGQCPLVHWYTDVGIWPAAHTELHT